MLTIATQRRMTVNMQESPTFFDIRNRILEWPGLSLAAKTIWISLCQYSWADGSCYHSRQSLADKHGLHLDTVKSARRELIKKGLITVFKRPLPETAVTFPFVKFQAIEQRDRNVVRLENQIGDKTTLLIGDIFPPIKEKILKENIKVQEKKEEGIEPYADGNGIDTDPEPVKHTKKPKVSKHRASREEQLDKIKANFAEYQTQYPEIDINLEIENFEYWLTNYPKGKMRKDIFATWKNWLHREHVQLQKRRKPATKNKKPSIHERGGFDAEAIAAYLSQSVAN